MVTEFASALANVSAEDSGKEYRVRRPSVKEALIILAVVERASGGDWDPWRDLKEVCAGWLPPGLFLSVFAGDIPRHKSLKFIGDLMKRGLSEAHEKNLESTQKKARKTSWREIIAEYATAWGMSPGEVLSASWPVFIAMYAEIERQRAREQLRMWEAVATARPGGKIDSLKRRADFGEKIYESPDSMDDDWFERQMERARSWRSRETNGEA